MSAAETDSCPDEALLSAYVAGELADAEREPIDRHLARCDDCRQLIAILAPPPDGIEATLPLSPNFAELVVGQVIGGKYAVETLIGAGGMGVVARARHQVLGTRVVVKLISAPRIEGDTLRRFLREARTGAAVDSPHVVRVLDAGVLESGRPYLVLEHLEGRDLSEELTARGQLPVGEAVDYVLQVCEALAVAHARGIVHRDIKPANLFLARGSDDTITVKVLDFGIAKAAEDSGLAEQSGALTDTTEVMGSPRYMSPEQLEHTAGVDARADVWSLGIVLYELLAGKPPFDAPTVAALATAILTREPTPLSELNPAVPRGLSDVIALTLVKSRDSRIQSVAALARALTPFASEDTTSLIARIERIAAGKRGSLPPRASQPPEPHAISTEGVAWRPPKSGGARATRIAALFVLAAVTGGVLAELVFARGAPPSLDSRLGSSGALMAAEARRRVVPAPPTATAPPSVPAPPEAPTVSAAPHAPAVRPPPTKPPPRPSSELHRDGLLDRK